MDEGKERTLEMPWKAVLEMLCDWIGAGIAINGVANPHGWYEANKKKMILHPTSRVYLRILLKASKVMKNEV